MARKLYDGCLQLPWRRYPAGADVLLFCDTLHLCVGRTPVGGWYAELPVSAAGGGGALFLANGEPSRDAAVAVAETWLSGHMAALLRHGAKTRRGH